MDPLCEVCGVQHGANVGCTTTQGSPVFRRRRSLVTSPDSTPNTSGRSTPTPGPRLASASFATGGDGPKQKQQRLSGDFEKIFESQTTLEDRDLKDEELSDTGEEETEQEPVGASQYQDEAEVDNSGDADGLLLGYAYLPSEVTLPNKFPAREGLVQVELTPGNLCRN